MHTPVIQCTQCQTALLDEVLNRPDLAPCPQCGAWLAVEVFPALFRRIAPGRAAETILIEGEAGCFYHPQKKAVAPCEICGRFLCAVCDCEVKGQHLCPACLESGKKKQSIAGLEDVRVLYRRTALVLAFLPLFITGLMAIFLAWRHWKTPDSLVAPRRWAMPVALAVGIVQTLAFTAWILLAFLG